MQNSTKQTLRTTVCPLLAAFIWGSAFVGQSVGAENIPPFTFSALRTWIGAAFLLVLSIALQKRTPLPHKQPAPYRKKLWLGAAASGLALAVATNLQQAGMGDTDAGKAGFITSLYVVLVPIFGLVCNRKAPVTVWVAAAIALVGLYLLCITDTFTIAPSDGLILLCAIFFALQILLIDRFSPAVNGIHYSCVQLTVSASISTVLMLVFERPTIENVTAGLLPLLYVGIMSSGIAYTLQVISQKNSNPTVVTLLLSLESVFAVLTGVVIQGDRLSARELIGCVLMFGAVTLANIPFKTRSSRHESRRQTTRDPE
ncbi:MAG: DMT family transporter [Clostridia bacterium]|nr:DMT family transporter [Clostridia bacterium]